MSSDESESLDNEYDASCFLCLRRFFFLSIVFLIDLLELLSFDELNVFDDESGDYRYGSGSPGTCTFPFCSGYSVGRVSGVCSVIFVPTGTKSIGDVVLLVVFVPRGVKSKVGQLIELFWRSKY